MTNAGQEIRELDRDSYKIVGMICSESAPEPEVQAAIDRLRHRAAEIFPDDPRVFDRVYARRFARLRTRFRPAPALFQPAD